MARPATRGRRSCITRSTPAVSIEIPVLRISSSDEAVKARRLGSKSQAYIADNAPGQFAEPATQEVRHNNTKRSWLAHLSEFGAMGDDDRGQSTLGCRHHLCSASIRV